jgi:hypothetical protein
MYALASRCSFIIENAYFLCEVQAEAQETGIEHHALYVKRTWLVIPHAYSTMFMIDSKPVDKTLANPVLCV